MKPSNSPNALEMVNALQIRLTHSYLNSFYTWNNIEPVLPQFGTTAEDVYYLYVERFGEKIAAGVPYMHVEGEDDLKDDGTLKDCYRYVTVTTTRLNLSGREIEVEEKIPKLSLVSERLNLFTVSPIKDNTYIAAGSDREIFGTEWGKTDLNNRMGLTGEDVFRKSYTVDKAYSNVQLRVVEDGSKEYGDRNG